MPATNVCAKLHLEQSRRIVIAASLGIVQRSLAVLYTDKTTNE